VKIITVSGAHRAVGKTSLARALEERLPGRTEVVKIGHGRDKGKPERLFRETEEFLAYLDALRSTGRGNIDVLIVESNRILDALKPDLALFLEPRAELLQNGEERSQSDAARRARLKADIRLTADSIRTARRRPAAFRRRTARTLRELGTLARRERIAVIRALRHHSLTQSGMTAAP